MALLGCLSMLFKFCRLISYIGVIAACVQILECFWINTPCPYNALGIFLLLSQKSAIGGIAFYDEKDLFGESVAYGLGAGVGWAPHQYRYKRKIKIRIYQKVFKD